MAALDPEATESSKKSFKFSLTESLCSERPLSEKLQAVVKAISSIQDIPDEARQRVVDWFEKHLSEKPIIRIITVGKTGSGKSTLLNAIVGTKKFGEADKLEPETVNVQECEVKIQGIRIIVYDCPGLEDGRGNEEAYLRQLSEKCPVSDTDLMFFCIRMNETRSAGNTAAFDTVTNILGKEVWEHAIVVLTFANMYKKRDCIQNPEIFEARIAEWKTVVHEQLKKNNIENSVCEKVQVQPAGHYRFPNLPGRNFWLSDLWGYTLLAMRKEKQSSLVAIGGLERGFIIPEEVSRNAHIKLDTDKQPIIVTDTVKDSIGEAVGHETSKNLLSAWDKIKAKCLIL